MIYLELITGFLISFATAALLIPLIIRLALRKGWVDKPDNHRKLHARPTPTVGGLAIAAGFAVGGLYLFFVSGNVHAPFSMPPLAFWVGALAMVCTGFYDDTRGLSFKGKLFVQVCVAYMLLHAGYRIDLSDLPFIQSDVYDQALFSIPLTLLWIVGVINAVNLIDGLDGLAGGVALIAFGCLSILFGIGGQLGLIMIGLVISGAVLAFLMYNFNPASIFMGDSGSLLLGYLLAVLSLSAKLHADPVLALLVPGVVLGLPVLDTSLSIIRRFQEGKAICAPDHDHIHHRLTRMWPTRKAVLVLYTVATGFGVAAILISLLSPGSGFAVLGATLVAVVVWVAALGYFRPVVRQAPRVKPAPVLLNESSGDGMNAHVDRKAVAGAEGDHAATRTGSEADITIAVSGTR